MQVFIVSSNEMCVKSELLSSAATKKQNFCCMMVFDKTMIGVFNDDFR